jgi:hypothetical protein
VFFFLWLVLFLLDAVGGGTVGDTRPACNGCGGGGGESESSPSMLVWSVIVAAAREAAAAPAGRFFLFVCWVDSETTTTFLSHSRANYHSPCSLTHTPLLSSSRAWLMSLSVSAGQGC